jgi:hypothetical protein
MGTKNLGSCKEVPLVWEAPVPWEHQWYTAKRKDELAGGHVPKERQRTLERKYRLNQAPEQ